MIINRFSVRSVCTSYIFDQQKVPGKNKTMFQTIFNLCDDKIEMQKSKFWSYFIFNLFNLGSNSLTLGFVTLTVSLIVLLLVCRYVRVHDGNSVVVTMIYHRLVWFEKVCRLGLLLRITGTSESSSRELHWLHCTTAPSALSCWSQV